MKHPWRRLEAALNGSRVTPGGTVLAELAEQALAASRHGDLAKWRQALADLPRARPLADLDRAAPRLGAPVEDSAQLEQVLMALHPWRKGPLCLGGVEIDTEWHSDWKWERLAPHVDLRETTVLDIGCGNGYFGWRMLGAGARCVVGVDPTLVFVMQWLAQAHFTPGLHNYVLPLGDADLPATLTGFDAVFSMGVLYHQRDSAAHLRRLAGWLRPGGQLVLETLVLDDPGTGCLVPEGRYARMRNVWHIPATGLLVNELSAGPFEDIRLVDVTPTTTSEQRSTPWMRFESLEQCLDPDDPARTVEGHPGPVRAVVVARRAS